KALYYSLRVDEALAELQRVREAAPHLAGVEDLWIEMLTLKGAQAQLVEALIAHVRRATTYLELRHARNRLARVVQEVGIIDAALEQHKQSADPAQRESYQRIGMLLQYFGRHDEAIEQFTLAGKSQRHSYNTGRTGSMLASACVARG